MRSFRHTKIAGLTTPYESVIQGFPRQSRRGRTLAGKLREVGFTIGRDRTRRLMKTLNLTVKQKRRYKVTTDNSPTLPVAMNLLNQQLNPSGLNQVWGTDITYLWTRGNITA